MGIMDQVREETGSGGDWLSKDEKASMVASNQAFNIWKMDRNWSNRNQRYQWTLTLLFVGSDGRTPYLVDDGEGGQEYVMKATSFTVQQENNWRDQQMAALDRLRQQGAAAQGQNWLGLGPLRLARVKVQGQGNDAYVLEDWAPLTGPASVPPPAARPTPPPSTAPSPTSSAPPPPPSSQPVVSPDGAWRLEDGQWVPNTPPPPPAPPQAPQSPASPPSAPRPAQSADGPPATSPVGSAASVSTAPTSAPENVPPFSEATGDSAAPAEKDARLAQPIPVSELVEGGAGSDDFGRPLGRLQVDQTPGSQIRQATYQGDGVVEGPNRNVYQAAAPERVPESAPSAPSGEAPQGKVQGPPHLQVLEGQERPSGQIGRSGSIMMLTRCDTCQQEVRGPAFKNSKGRFIMTHQCSARQPGSNRAVGTRTLDVHDQVMALQA